MDVLTFSLEGAPEGAVIDQALVSLPGRRRSTGPGVVTS